MIPGSNLLNVALRTIAEQTVSYSVYLTRGANEIGQLVSTYDTPVALKGSFQAVPRDLYGQYGLDLSKYYARFFISKNALPVDRNVSGDQVTYSNRVFKVESETDWYTMDGWAELLLVKIDDE